MKIRAVIGNNRRKAFEVRIANRTLVFPYAKVDPRPAAQDPLVRVFADPGLNREGFSYVLTSGRKGTVHVELLTLLQVLDCDIDLVVRGRRARPGRAA